MRFRVAFTTQTEPEIVAWKGRRVVLAHTDAELCWRQLRLIATRLGVGPAIQASIDVVNTYELHERINGLNAGKQDVEVITPIDVDYLYILNDLLGAYLWD